MSNPLTSRIDVLIVGAGPTGLTMAAELHRHGLTCRIVDKNDGPSIWSKAQIIHARSLEAFEDMGVVGPMLERGRQMHGFDFFTPDLKRVAHIQVSGLESIYDFMLSLSQRDTELILEEHLASLGLRVDRQLQLERFEQDDEGVTASLLYRDGTRDTVRTSWLIGCDGAHSTVRHTLDLPFEGSTYEQRILQADIRIDWRFPHGENEVIGFLSPAGILACFPLPEAGRYRLLTFVEPESELQPVLETFEQLMLERGPAGTTVSDPKWMVDFRFHCRIVPRYRMGRVFLAGDAAHIHSPAGGQGMNTGIQDAYNLAWKLALVQRGQGHPVLLDSYHDERHPIAAATLEGTDRATRGGANILGLRHPLAQGLRNSLMSFVSGLGLVQQKVSRTLSMLDLHYEHSPILAQERPAVLSTPVFDDRTTETPALRDWLDFGNGPGPGQRACDVELPETAEGPKRMLELFHGTQHTLLLFDGAAETAEGYRNLELIASRVEARYGERIRTWMVIPGARRPEGLNWEGPLLLDSDGEVHRHFGARSECLYLVRPDGYVGYRSQPADAAKLLHYLARILV